MRSTGTVPAKHLLACHPFSPDYDDQSRAEFVGHHLEQPLHRLSFDRSASFANDKPKFETTLRATGFPTPTTSALSRKVRAGGSCGGPGWSAPTVTFLGSDAGSFSSLSGEEFGGQCIGVAPAEVCLESGSEHDVIWVVRVVEHELS